MIHTVYIDDATSDGEKILRELRHYKKEVRFEEPTTSNNSVLEGYMTSEDFWKEADRRIINVCKQYGVL